MVLFLWDFLFASFYLKGICPKSSTKNWKYLNLKIQTSDFSSGPVGFLVTGPNGPVARNS